VFGIHVFRFPQQLQNFACARRQPSVLRQALPLGRQPFYLSGLEVQGFQLAEVIAQELEPRFAILRRSGGAIPLFAKL
jgi:adenine/guanine phosphoribosyltransferase-like PRPP-binding protein